MGRRRSGGLAAFAAGAGAGVQPHQPSREVRLAQLGEGDRIAVALSLHLGFVPLFFAVIHPGDEAQEHLRLVGILSLRLGMPRLVRQSKPTSVPGRVATQW